VTFGIVRRIIGINYADVIVRVSWVLIMLMWHHINEKRDDKSFMGAERVS
jgi:hypothetical protein